MWFESEGIGLDRRLIRDRIRPLASDLRREGPPIARKEGGRPHGKKQGGGGKMKGGTKDGREEETHRESPRVLWIPHEFPNVT